jgi:uncharacterized protein
MVEYKKAKIKADMEVEGRTITGYAAAFNNIDKVRDIIHPGAFKQTINGGRVKVGYNHTYIIGKPVVMQEDSKGLYTESYISDTPRGNEVLQLVKDGVLDTMSIAYEPVKYDDDAKGIRHLRELKLYEYGVVDFAANDDAVVTGVKQFAHDLEQGQGLTPDALNRVRASLKSLLDAIDATADTVQTYPHAEPDNSALVDLKSIGLDMLGEIAEAMKSK